MQTSIIDLSNLIFPHEIIISEAIDIPKPTLDFTVLFVNFIKWLKNILILIFWNRTIIVNNYNNVIIALFNFTVIFLPYFTALSKRFEIHLLIRVFLP